MQLVILFTACVVGFNCFIFLRPTVEGSPLTINTLAQYTIALYRQFDSLGGATNWDSQAVPAGSNITITFPQQYTIDGSQTCDLIAFGGIPSTTFSCSINSASRQVVFVNSIISDTFVSSVLLQISSVLNPSPAITTSPFQATIGNDVSAVDTSGAASVGLERGQLSSISIGFTPTTVNSTSSMIVTIVNTNPIPSTGSIKVAFPPTLYWIRDVAQDLHQIPLDTVNICSAIQNINFLVECTGSNANKEVILTSPFDGEIASGTEMIFSVNNIFSPPTTQPIDQITVTIYATGDSSQPIDEGTGIISGLTPKSMTFNMSSTTSFQVNREVGIVFTFVLADTVTKDDVFEVRFPTGTVINLLTELSFSFGIDSASYNSGTNTLTITQSSASTTRQVGFTASITVINYLCPPSTKPTDSIEFVILNNGFEKMKGSNTITANPNSYSMTMESQSTQINVQTSYSLSLNMNDSISSSGYMEITLPSTLTISPTFTVAITGDSSIVSSPSAQLNSGKIVLRNLNSSSSSINNQNLNITINGITQPGSVKEVSGISADIFYSSEGFKTASALTTNTITSTPGSIASGAVSPGSSVTADEPVPYEFTYTSLNPIPAGSRVEVTLPTNDVTILGGGTCTAQTVSTSCTVNGNVISFDIGSQIPGSTPVSLTYSSIKNPLTTKQTQSFSINVFNDVGQLVDVVTSTITTAMTVPSSLTASLSRSSQQNDEVTAYILQFTQNQILQNSSKAIITMPTQVMIGNISCISQNAQTLPCTVSGNIIKVTLNVQPQQNYDYRITITNLQNPPSYEPTSSITIGTVTSDQLYSYSQVTTGLTITNTLPSSFPQLNYSFSNQYLAENSILTVNVEGRSSPSYYIIQLASSFTLGTIACFSSEFVPICDVNNNIVRVTSGAPIPSIFSLNLTGITNPSSLPNDYSWVSSYSSTDFLMSDDKNTIIFTTLCTFPCKDCTSTLTQCTLCYPQSLTTKIYLFNSQCLSTCPSGYYENVLDLKCSPCLVPCAQCENQNNYCTYCDLNTTFIYLNRTNTTSTCLSACPAFMYADVTQIPNVCTQCVSPCGRCSDVSVCETCASGFYLYGTQCLVQCPVDLTVLINDQCVDCSNECATCSVAIDNCTSCSSIAALHNGNCVLTCPNNMIIVSGACVSCDPKCKTCEVQIDNCTSCEGAFPYYFNFDCLTACPDYYYIDSFNDCQECSLLGRGCANCSSPSVCLSCDDGFVLLNNNCLNQTPSGYLNISGVAQACLGDCQTCSVTLTNCTSCKTLNLFGNTCTDVCPSTTTAVNQICQPCTYPCNECSGQTTLCLSCQANSSLFFFGSDCVADVDCPVTTYGNPLTIQCDPCISPCLDCNSSVSCLSCIAGYFYYGQGLECVLTCPIGMVGVNKDCVFCTSPCQECSLTATRCTSCISNFYFNSDTNECLSQCPTGLIPNDTLMTCVPCASPCKTCVNTIDTCLSCVTGTFLSINSCVNTCPQGFYGSSGFCLGCQNNCTTCSSISTCLTCSVPFALFSEQCLQTCPVTHSIVSNNSVCISCETVMVGCSNCSENGQCFECFSPKIYFNTQCLDQCPEGYSFIDFTCIVTNGTTQTQTPDPVLSASSIFPLPFTILGCVMFIACCLSKIQNINTYLVGVAYAIFGFVETGVIAYLLVRYYLLGSTYYEWNMVLLLLVVLGIIYLLNLVSLITQTILLCFDTRFSAWLAVYCSNRGFFGVITIFSMLINYKLKMVLFTKLFNFQCMRAQLESVHKFRMFNVFSFFGLVPEGLCLYVCFISIFNFVTGTEIFMWFLDAIIVVIINIILAIWVAWKKDDFFAEIDQEDGLILNKKFNAVGEDISKEALDPYEYEDQFINKEYQSYNPLEKGAGIIESEEYSVSMSVTEEQVKETVEVKEESVKQEQKRKINVYFQNQNTDTVIFHKNTENFTKTKAQNIFQQSERSQKPKTQEKLDLQSMISEAGGSQKVILSPTKTMKHAVVQSNIHSNKATATEDINKKISQREQELDELKQQMQEKQRNRKQLARQMKLMKKSIQPISSIETRKFEEEKQQSFKEQSNKQQSHKEPSVHYEEISIKESTNRERDDLSSNQERQLQRKKNRPKILFEEQPHEDIENQINPPHKNQGWLEMKANQSQENLPIFTTLHGDRQSQTYKEGTEEEEVSIRNIKPSKLKTVEQMKSTQKEQKSKTIEVSSKQYEKQEQKREEQKKQEEQRQEQQRQLQKKQVFKDHQSIVKQEEKQEQKSQQQQQKSKGKSEKHLKSKSSENRESLTISLEKSAEDEQFHGYYQYENRNFGREQQQSDSQIAKPQYVYDQSNTEYDKRDNTKQNFYNIEEDEEPRQSEGLEDSQNEDEDINNKPIQAINQKGMNSYEALVQAVKEGQKHKFAGIKPISHKRIPKELKVKTPQKEKIFKPSSPPQQDNKLVSAGVRQIEDQTLSNKQMDSHPIKKSSISKEDISSEAKLSLNSSNRNRSFNNPPNFKKFTSKDLSKDSDGLDDLDFQKISIKPSYLQLMNQRDQSLERDQRVPRKPGTSSSSRAHYHGSSKLSKLGVERMNLNNRTISGEDDDLKQYYKKDEEGSMQKKQSKERLSKSKKKSQSKSKEKVFEGERMKYLKKIYLPKK